MEERAFHPLDYVSVLRRRKYWFIAPVVASILIGAILVLVLPRTYYTEAEIGVASATLSPELLRGVTSLDQGERQRAISQQLLSRTVLERVVREERIQPEKPVEEVAALLRNNVEITVDKPLARNDTKNGLDSFRLGYKDSTPERTMNIANRLAYVFVEENSKTQTKRAENTSEVLLQQLNGSQERLAGLEEQLRVKKEANMGRLPDQINSNIQMVNGLRQQLESISMQLSAEQSRLSNVDAQLEAMRQGSGGAALTSTAAASIQGVQSRLNLLQQRLTEARAIGYTDKHPEVVNLQAEIAQARADLNTVKQSGGSSDVLQADPLYRQKMSERNEVRTRISTLRMAESQTRARINQFEAAVAAAPRVEQDLQAVQRDVDLEKARYMDLKNKYESARLAEDLARKQGGERFSVLYGAGLPDAPLEPDIVRLMLMAVALGFVLGAVLVVGREFMDRSVHDARALQSEFEVPVLGEIPRIHGAPHAGVSH
jgi:polysaccharide chain length determinant protein (PEP-CTERM system associated)